MEVASFEWKSEGLLAKKDGKIWFELIKGYKSDPWFQPDEFFEDDLDVELLPDKVKLWIDSINDREKVTWIKLANDGDEQLNEGPRYWYIPV